MNIDVSNLVFPLIVCGIFGFAALFSSFIGFLCYCDGKLWRWESIVNKGEVKFFRCYNNDATLYVVISFLALLALIIPTVICTPQLVDVYNSSFNNHVYNIVSIERDSGIDGKFFLGTGYVEGTQYYYFYTETDHGLKLEKASHEYTYLVEDSSKTPAVYDWKESRSWKHYYTVYVPEGTVVKEFKA